MIRQRTQIVAKKFKHQFDIANRCNHETIRNVTSNWHISPVSGNIKGSNVLIKTTSSSVNTTTRKRINHAAYARPVHMLWLSSMRHLNR